MAGGTNGFFADKVGPWLLGLVAAALVLLATRYLDTGREDSKLLRDGVAMLTREVSTLKTDVAVIKAVVVDSQLARRVDSLERELALVREKVGR